MPQKRKTRNNRKKRGGNIDPYALFDNKGQVIPGQYKNRRGIPPSPLPGTPPSTPPPSPPPLARSSGYDRSEQQDFFSSDESTVSPARSVDSYSSLSDDGLAPSLQSWYEIMGDAAATPPPRIARRLNLNLGSGLLKRKSRKNRKMRKNKKTRNTRKNRKMRKTRTRKSRNMRRRTRK